MYSDNKFVVPQTVDNEYIIPENLVCLYSLVNRD